MKLAFPGTLPGGIIWRSPNASAGSLPQLIYCNRKSTEKYLLKKVVNGNETRRLLFTHL